MERTTKADVMRMLENTKRAATLVGIDSSGWHVDVGSQTYGRAWRLYRLEAESGAHFGCGVPDYLGWSAREARDTLHHYAEAWYAADRAAAEARRVALRAGN